MLNWLRNTKKDVEDMLQKADAIADKGAITPRIALDSVQSLIKHFGLEKYMEVEGNRGSAWATPDLPPPYGHDIDLVLRLKFPFPKMMDLSWEQHPLMFLLKSMMPGAQVWAFAYQFLTIFVSATVGKSYVLHYDQTDIPEWLRTPMNIRVGARMTRLLDVFPLREGDELPSYPNEIVKKLHRARKDIFLDHPWLTRALGPTVPYAASIMELMLRSYYWANRNNF